MSLAQNHMWATVLPSSTVDDDSQQRRLLRGRRMYAVWQVNAFTMSLPARSLKQADFFYTYHP